LFVLYSFRVLAFKLWTKLSPKSAGPVNPTGRHSDFHCRHRFPPEHPPKQPDLSRRADASTHEGIPDSGGKISKIGGF
jgi:hypothetical protein